MCRLHIFNIIVYFNFLLINKNKYYCIKKIYKKLIIYKKNVKCHKKAPKKKSHFSNFFKIFFRFFFFQNLISKNFLNRKKKFFIFGAFLFQSKVAIFANIFFRFYLFLNYFINILLFKYIYFKYYLFYCIINNLF